MKLYEELCAYTPCNLQEEADRKVMMRYIKEFLNVYTRDNVYGHITSSPWIINADASKVLMIYHNIYNSWGLVRRSCGRGSGFDPCRIKGGKRRNRTEKA